VAARAIGVSLSAALVLTVFATVPAAAVVTDATCDVGGSVSFNPAVVAHATAVDVAMQGTASSSDGNCPNDPGSPAAIRGTLHTAVLRCNVHEAIFGRPAKGTVTIAWSQSSVSTVSMTLSLVKGSLPHLAGRVLSGPFVGDHVTATVAISTTDLCKHGGISSGTFVSGGHRHLQPLRFRHS
jgi:hypothetical protein